MTFRPTTLEDGIFQQRRTTMNYTKPEVSILGDAVKAIEVINHSKTPLPPPEFRGATVGPAYDLDE
jgi:hypothetical protein